MNDGDLNVRLAALHSVSLLRDREALPLLVESLEHRSPAIRRAAASSSGRLEDPAVVPQLLRAASVSRMNRVLEHSITYALIEIGKPIDLKSIPGDQVTPVVEQIAMIANDQMPGGQLDPQSVVPWLTSKEPELKQTALWLVGRHSEWGERNWQVI